MNHIDENLLIPVYVTAKGFKRIIQKQLKQLDLTFTQFIVLRILDQSPDLYVKEIGKQLALDSGTLTPVLKKLEEKGYVLRTPSVRDARDLLVQITPEGHQLILQSEKLRQDLAGKIEINEEKVRRLNDLLTEFAAIMQEITCDEI